MGEKSARRNDAGERETDDADRSAERTQWEEEETTEGRSDAPDAPTDGVRVVGRAGQSRGQTRTERSGGSRGTGEGYVDYERGPDPRALSERYGMEVRAAAATKLQRLESEFGRERVSRWADEGMPVEAMGKPRDMQAFRKRQEDRPDEVPTDIERRNGTSLRRNTDQNREEGPAGKTGVSDVVRNVISSPGRSMNETVQREMESKMGGSFSDVQLHTGPEAAAAADSINARAFTVGNHIAFNRGEYQPESDLGKKLLAHELAHVRQQTEGTVSLLSKANAEHPGTGVHVQPKLEVSSPDDPAEREAERIAEKVVRMDESDRRAQPTGGNGEGGQGLSDPTPQPSKPVGVSRGNSGVSEAAESAVSSGFQGNGEPLPAEIRPGFESKMGADISDVRAHSGLEADEAARSTNAEAYAMDSDVVFKKSNYRPNGSGGKALLAHESTHVVQQRADRSAADTTPQLYRATTVDGSQGTEPDGADSDAEEGQTERFLNAEGEHETLPASVVQTRADRLTALIQSELNRLDTQHGIYQNLLDHADDHPVTYTTMKWLGWGTNPNPAVLQAALDHFDAALEFVQRTDKPKNFYQARRNYEKGLKHANKYIKQFQQLQQAINFGGQIAITGLKGVKEGSKIFVGVAAGVVTGGWAAAGIAGGYGGLHKVATQASEWQTGLRDRVEWAKIGFETAIDVVLGYVENSLYGSGTEDMLKDYVEGKLLGDLAEEFGEETAREIVGKVRIHVAKALTEVAHGKLKSTVKTILTGAWDAMSNEDLTWMDVVKQVLRKLVQTSYFESLLKKGVRSGLKNRAGDAVELGDTFDIDAVVQKLVKDKDGILKILKSGLY